VLFDRDLQVQAHVCGKHRAQADHFPCGRHGPWEPCDHVHYQPCRCATHPPCVGCLQVSLPLEAKPA
jgi:hypothetical protein